MPHVGYGRPTITLGGERARDHRAQLAAVDDHVDGALVEQELGALEAFRQLLADGLLDHARACKTDQCTRLCQMHIAQHRVGCRDAARGGIGQYNDIGLFCLAQHFDRDRRTRHLHQRQDALLHARAARRREQPRRRFAQASKMV